VHNVSDVRQKAVHAAEPLVPGPSRLEVETAIAKLKRYNYPAPGGYKYGNLALQVGGVSNETVKYGREFCGTSTQV
jgi:hypothetical protein